MKWYDNMAGYDPTSFFKGKSTGNSEVVVSFDPTVIKKRETLSELERDKKKAQNKVRDGEYKDTLIMEKSDRKLTLDSAIRTKKVTSISEASKLVGVSPTTVRRYLKELGYRTDGLKNIVR